MTEIVALLATQTQSPSPNYGASLMSQSQLPSPNYGAPPPNGIIVLTLVGWATVTSLLGSPSLPARY